MHTTTERRPSEAERIQIASLESSTKENEREKFREGALWYRDNETDNGVSPHGAITALEVTGFILFILIVLSTLATGFSGIMDGAGQHSREDTCQLSGKWGYIFPAYKLGCKAAQWMSKE